jgi:hypothetical protein
MKSTININQLEEKYVDELTLEELIAIHLSTSISPIILKDAKIRSTFSILYQNIRSSMTRNNTNALIPYLSLCAILDQIGTCYDRKDLRPRYQNGIKRCLVNFGGFREDDEAIDIIYVLRNGLIHSVSLTSWNRYTNKHYLFGFNNNIESLYKNAETEWHGDYDVLDSNGREKYTTQINVDKFMSLVDTCIDKANELNEESILMLRPNIGKKQLFYNYLRAIEK